MFFELFIFFIKYFIYDAKYLRIPDLTCPLKHKQNKIYLIYMIY